MDIEPQTIHYEGDGHIALYTDGLTEAVQGDQEMQQAFLKEQLAGSHQWDEAAMQALFFDDEIPQERDDDKCLVWITLNKGVEAE
jgi:sigma-B regulation protein RsbU (phosphoserine phosphatase)